MTQANASTAWNPTFHLPDETLLSRALPRTGPGRLHSQNPTVSSQFLRKARDFVAADRQTGQSTALGI